jgi:hypothetical protein
MSYTRPLAIALLALATILVAGGVPVTSGQDRGWTITSFDVTYEINEGGTVRATEEIAVDFGSLERHGIFREIPVEYEYDASNYRLMTLTDISIDDGESPIEWTTDSSRPNLVLRIGDPDVLVTGEQLYRIQYTINNGLNPFSDHDELFWNVTGDDWPVPIESGSATVMIPGEAIVDVDCFEGPRRSTARCHSAVDSEGATFRATSALPAGSGMTLVVALKKGAVTVGPPVLVPTTADVFQEIDDFLGLDPLPIGITIVLAVAGLAGVYSRWWVAGRDRWFGNLAVVPEGAEPTRKPLGAQETVVVEYEPPDLALSESERGTFLNPGEAENRQGRRLRPAEVGLLMDERADTLDVTATIVDLAVRGHLRIKETKSGGILGLFKKDDYELERIEIEDASLLPYEQRLKSAIFEDGEVVQLSDLKNKFHEDLKLVKTDLYEDAVRDLKFFPRNPETVRTIYQAAGVVIALVGGALVFVLGSTVEAGIAGFAVILTGVVLLLFAATMPRRSATGRRMYRRCVGFRLYMETAEKDRQRFAENENIFHEYLPYAIVYGCVEKWAGVFEELGLEPKANWYVGQRGFVPLTFASTMNNFSSSVSTVMASTPGSSGSSGFGGGGFSGGGGGGGGGGSW